MTTYEPGDILLIPFPFTDFSTLKQRPCVVLSSATFNHTHEDVIVAALTSRIPKEPTRDSYVLSASEQRACALPKPSLIRVGKIVTLDQRLIRKRLGRLPRAGRIRLLTKVRRLFASSRG